MKPTTDTAETLTKTEREFLDSLNYLKPCDCGKQCFDQGALCAFHPKVYNGFMAFFQNGERHYSTIHRHTAETATYIIDKGARQREPFFRSRSYDAYRKELETISQMSEAEYYETF